MTKELHLKWKKKVKLLQFYYKSEFLVVGANLKKKNSAISLTWPKFTLTLTIEHQWTDIFYYYYFDVQSIPSSPGLTQLLQNGWIKNCLWTYMSLIVQFVVGEFEFVKADHLSHPCVSWGQRVRVDVDPWRNWRVGITSHHPFWAVIHISVGQEGKKRNIIQISWHFL